MLKLIWVDTLRRVHNDGFLVERLIYTFLLQEYLFKIFKKEVKSELHQVIIGGTVKERRNIKHQGFGPIDDEEQVHFLSFIPGPTYNKSAADDFEIIKAKT